MSLFAELKRRNVIRVGGAYVVVAWLLIQVADILLGNFGAPDWVFKSFTALLLLGFPLALFLSWAYDLTPEGVKRAADVPAEASAGAGSVKPIDWMILVGLVLVVAVVLADRVWRPSAPELAKSSETVEDGGAQSEATPTPSADTTEPVFVAVLPFDNFSPDPADAYFAGGMTEEINSQLSRVSALRVVSRTAVSRALESQLPLAEIATTLGVSTVLEGSVRKAGDMIRITTQLVDANTGQHIWSTDFDRELADVFAIQREVALAIVAALHAELSPDERARIDAPPTDDLAAYQLYLRNREFSSLGVATNQTGIELLRQAVALAPDFVDAWARLSWRHTWAARLGDRAAVEEAFATARRALELDPQEPMAHFALGSAYTVSEEVEAVIASFERAVALDPDHFTLLDLSARNAWTGRQATGLAQMMRAVRLSRNVPNVRFHAGIVLRMLGDHRRLQDWLDLAAAEGMEWHRLDLQRASMYATQGHPREALEVLEAGRVRWPDSREFEREAAALQLFLGQGGAVRGFLERQAQLTPESHGWMTGMSARTQFARLLHEEGDVERAAPLFAESLRVNEEMYAAGRGWPTRWLESAAIRALQGRHEEALEWLERTFRSGYYVPGMLAHDRAFSALRDDPRFQAVMTQMSDAQAAQRARVEAEGIALELDAMIAAGPGAPP